MIEVLHIDDDILQIPANRERLIKVSELRQICVLNLEDITARRAFREEYRNKRQSMVPDFNIWKTKMS